MDRWLAASIAQAITIAFLVGVIFTLLAVDLDGTSESDSDQNDDQGGGTVFLSEGFEISGWTDHTGSSFGVDIEGGVNGSALHLYGDGYDASPYVSRYIDISDWKGTMWLELDFRAKSSTKTGIVTNAFVNLVDPLATDRLQKIMLVEGGKLDSGWIHRRFDVSAALRDHSGVEIQLRFADGWGKDYNQEAWFDNVSLYAEG